MARRAGCGDGFEFGASRRTGGDTAHADCSDCPLTLERQDDGCAAVRKSPCMFDLGYCVGVFRDVRLAFARQADCRRRGREAPSLSG